MYDPGYFAFGGWPWLGLAGFVLFWGAVIVGIVLLVRHLSHSGRPPFGAGPPWQAGPAPWHAGPPYPPAGGPTPEQILAERFARGDIDEQEFRQRLATLRTSAHPGTPPGPGAPPGPGMPPPGVPPQGTPPQDPPAAS